MIDNLEIKSDVYTSPNSINKIVEATYNGESVYCFIHSTSGRYAIMEYEEDVLETVKYVIKAYGTITYSSGQFTISRYRSLQAILYAVYKGISIDELEGHIVSLRDASLKEYGCYDFRRKNLYDAKDEYSVDIVSDANGTPKLIRFCMKDKKSFEVAAIQDYSPELYEILKRVTAVWREKQERHYVRIDGKGKPMQLARLVLLYEDCFKEYKETKTPIKAFLADVPKLNQNFIDRNLEAAHINGCKWNNRKGNLMWMSKSTNDAMSDFITRFMDMYRVFTTLTEDGTILVVIENSRKTYGFALETAEKYANMQRIALGVVDVTKKLTSIFGVPSPRIVYEKQSKEEKEDGFSVADCVNWEIKSNTIKEYYSKHPEKFKRLGVPYIIPSSGHEVTNDLKQDIFKVFIPEYISGELDFFLAEIVE